MTAIRESASAAETAAAGRAIAQHVRPGDVVLLHGDLGAGKTTLVQGIAEGLQVADRAQSPTFTLIAEYDGLLANGEPVTLYHLDLYRLEHPDDLDSIGYGDLLESGDGIVVIEWPERAGDLLPDNYLLITIEIAGPDRRRMTFHGVGEGARLVAPLTDRPASS